VPRIAVPSLSHGEEKVEMMVKKTFPINGEDKVHYCYTICPREAGIELYTIINTELAELNAYLDRVYTAYKKVYPKVTRPKLYVYLRDDNNIAPDGFTEGVNIYLSASIMFALFEYVDEHINHAAVDWEKLMPAPLKENLPLQIYDRLLKIVVSHELTHIWHCHIKWMKSAGMFGDAMTNCNQDDIFFEMVKAVETDGERVGEGYMPGIDNLVIKEGKIYCNSKEKSNYIQQILEIDADCCAMSLVLNDLQRDMASLAKLYVEEPEKHKKDINAVIACHRYLLGTVCGASALMFGYFDRKRCERPFECLSKMLDEVHPIPAIRFLRMDAVMRQMVHERFEDKEVERYLLDYTYIFAAQIFMDNGKTIDLKSCFWAPAMTEQAQIMIAELQNGWNAIHDSLQKSALMPLPGKFDPEELLVPNDLFWYDDKGNDIIP